MSQDTTNGKRDLKELNLNDGKIFLPSEANTSFVQVSVPKVVPADGLETTVHRFSGLPPDSTAYYLSSRITLYEGGASLKRRPNTSGYVPVLYFNQSAQEDLDSTTQDLGIIRSLLEKGPLKLTHKGEKILVRGVEVKPQQVSLPMLLDLTGVGRKIGITYWQDELALVQQGAALFGANAYMQGVPISNGRDYSPIVYYKIDLS
ncbi:hypothetical protein HYV87_03690 [Candidatus Woesearchaeota archaeon]|nr:hypothetical protein [Candidatus Woesearchaeota archaeon]MBI2582197.1 hypothetical protein [Candidatus Woesearchaeota archaeon]